MMENRCRAHPDGIIEIMYGVADVGSELARLNAQNAALRQIMNH